MKKCLHCGCNIPRTRNYNRAKYCDHQCYADSLKGKPSTTVHLATAAAAKANRGCTNRTRENADDWFWAKVDKGSPKDCWNWTGYTNNNGYGLVGRFNGKREERATHISLWLETGKFPRNFALHSCDNPKCVNPAHLRDGTLQENTVDAVARDRVPWGERSASSKLTEVDVRYIRASSESNKALGRKYGVHPVTILKARRGETWSRVVS